MYKNGHGALWFYDDLSSFINNLKLGDLIYPGF